MKEIDFLPDWYKSSTRWQGSYCVQYAVLGVIFAMMIAWNFIATGSASKAASELARGRPKQVEAGSVSREFAGLKSQLAGLRKRANVLREIDSKIDVSSVLAEISFLVGEKVVLSGVIFEAEKFSSQQPQKMQRVTSNRLSMIDGRYDVPLGNVRFKVVISGLAADGSNVAEFVCKLEDSPYFCQVCPVFSRERKLKRQSDSRAERQTAVRLINELGTEFEITSYLANYREEQVCFL